MADALTHPQQRQNPPNEASTYMMSMVSGILFNWLEVAQKVFAFDSFESRILFTVTNNFPSHGFGRSEVFWYSSSSRKIRLKTLNRYGKQFVGYIGRSPKRKLLNPVCACVIRGDPTLVKTNVAITTGYLISDLLLIFYYWKAIGDKFFVVHHLAALYAYYYVLGQGMLPYFANFRLLAEFSTPCVNQRWFFEVLGYPKSSRPNMANGVAMAVVFFVVRIAVMPVYYSRMYAVYGTEAFYLVPWGGRVAWIGSSICLDVMNIMWMHKITRGCYKVLRSARRSKAPAPQENGKTD